MKPRILVLYTGGTIGMQKSDDGYRPVQGFAKLLSNRLRGRTLEPLPQYDLIEFDELIDSANLHPDDWSKIAETLIDNWDSYDGFVVLHGTDTMAYTASALSFILYGLNKPVIVTGSQVPLIELRNDAFANVVTSLILAANGDLHEVCLYFNGRIIRGNRARKVKSSGFDAFDSPNFPWLGTAGIDIDIRRDLLLRPKTLPDFHSDPFLAGSVAIAPLYPGIEAQTIQGILASGRVKALILQSYGVGNPPDKNRDLIKALEHANDNGVVVVNLTQCYEGGVFQGAYATGATLNRIGVIPGADMTPEAAFTKLHYLISMGLDSQTIRSDFPVPLCGECS